jgi:hypothetical protein
MNPPPILIGLGSGREAWISIDLSSLRFFVEIETDSLGRKVRRESLSLKELKTQFPRAATAVAAALVQAVKSAD